MPHTSITIQYLGVIRLILGKKEDILEFSEPPDLESVQQALAAKYGFPITQACRQQTFLYYPPHTTAAKVLVPDDTLAHNSTLKIASLVTGG